MKHRQVFYFLLLSCAMSAQMQDLGYAVNRQYAIDVTYEKLASAETLKDLHQEYPDMMIEQEAYKATLLSSHCDGQNYTAKSRNDKLSIEQKNLLNKLTQGCYVAVEVHYLLPNSVTRNDELRTMKLQLRVSPTKEAQFHGGEAALLGYFRKHLTDSPTREVLLDEPIEVEFIIDSSGKTTDLFLKTATNNTKANEHILELVRHMPTWAPAENASGKKIKQPYVFTAGSMVGC